MEEPIAFAVLNDFVFCPASIYFHGMYDGIEGLLYKEAPQLRGTQAHSKIDAGTQYNKDIISGISLYVERYNLIGKIDCYKESTHTLIESKRVIKTIYDGYIFQLYAQYFGMIEAGYPIDELRVYDISHNKFYSVAKPEEDPVMLKKFESLIKQIRAFSLADFTPESSTKCQNCIYCNICSWSLND